VEVAEFMSKHKKRIWYYAITIVYFAVFAVSFNVGVANNPNFNIHDFCMRLASELVGLIFAVVIVENYIRMKTERAKEKKQTRDIGKELNLTQSGFEVISCEGFDVVKSISTLKDKQTGVQYLLVIHENGSGLTPLLDKDGKPVIDE